MRRVTPQADRGAVTLMVVLITPFLLLFAAFVLDGGRVYVGKREAQNSADAAALAMAIDCARGVSCGASGTAAGYTKSGSTVASASCDTGAASCSVSISKTITQTFNVGLSGTVTRSATARWGTLGSATTAPVVVSQCTFDLATANGTTFPSAEVIIPLGAGGPSCPGRPPGAFGWLDTGLSGPCSILTTLNSSGQIIAHGNTGNGNVNPWDCLTSVGVNGQLMLPIYGASCFSPSPCVQGQNDGTGNNNYYLILGFAELQITGWNLQHGSPRTSPGGTAPNCPGSGSASCLKGRFVRFTTQLGSPGGGTNFGVTVVYLSS
jgi:Flp pilus assembly protein TadG